MHLFWRALGSGLIWWYCIGFAHKRSSFSRTQGVVVAHVMSPGNVLSSSQAVPEDPGTDWCVSHTKIKYSKAHKPSETGVKRGLKKARKP